MSIANKNMPVTNWIMTIMREKPDSAGVRFLEGYNPPFFTISMER